ncbi:MAG: hypothetical protein HN472_00855 [Nitrospina sp.]|jgi:hypothetical protein|nr:hypothetical protein [Nitrospina sp.]MBT3508075.1 hypothetical protein [Nitrospina sp.]MBT3876672.1 hypothetical protein [Nitrospina sp.]MBT4049621.1 hypothetical protein [Nitrospina sp.]MBT4558333.1 hypothetical protein [Nitrospina sp.]
MPITEKNSKKIVYLDPLPEDSPGRALAQYAIEWMNGNREISLENLKFLALCTNDKDLKWLQNNGT